MIFKFPCNFLYLLLCTGILSLEAKTDDSLQQHVTMRNTTTCDPTPITITSFTQQTSFVILEVVSYGGGNITLCTSPSTTCYIGTSTGMVLYPSASKGETHLTAYLSVILPHITESIGLNAYKYGANDPVPGGGAEVTDAALHHSLRNGLDTLSLHRAAAGADCMPTGGDCDPAGNASALLLYDVFVMDADQFHSNYTYTQACERTGTSSPHDDVTIGCVKRGELRASDSLKRFVWSGGDVMSVCSIFGGHGCRDVVVVVQVTDPAFNSTSAYLPFHLNTGSSMTTGGRVGHIILMVVNCFVLLVGFLLCFFGHRLFPFSFLVHCWFVFTFVFSTALSPLMAYELVGYEQLIEISTGVAALLDVILFVFWWKNNLTKMAVLIISICGGFVTSCILLATKLSSLPIMQYQLYVISFFSSISLLFISLNLLMTSQRLVMMTSSLLGSSLMIYSCSSWVCSSVISLLIPHALRRLVTVNFGHIVAVTNSLGQADEILIGVWCSLFVLGLFSQFCHHKSKANLPPTSTQPEHITPPQVDDASSDDCSAGTYSYDGDVSDDTDPSENDDVTVPFRIVDERTNLLPPRAQTIT